jgi:hypothetical protein
VVAISDFAARHRGASDSCRVDRASTEDPSILASAFQALDEEINRWLRSGDLKELPADQLAACLRSWNALRRIQNELLSLYDLENQLQRSAQDAVLQSDPPRVPRKIDRRLVIIGIKGGLVSVVLRSQDREAAVFTRRKKLRL